MFQVFIYSILLVFGLSISQLFEMKAYYTVIHGVTMICLSYIMIDVGLEFNIDKTNLKYYGRDYLIATSAAAFPWLFCAIYFLALFDLPWKQTFFLSRFAAPTSAGILFAMLMSVKLKHTWVYKRARILAIFDDLDTILLLIPLQVMLVGLKPRLLIIIIIIFALLYLSYAYLHRLRLPHSKPWLLFYGMLIAFFCEWVRGRTLVALEVLLPSFAFGCILYFKDGHHDSTQGRYYWHNMLDTGIKALFMLFVGFSIPKINLEGYSINSVIFHVLVITILSNIGKCLPLFCYKKEASLNERLALCTALFPRGEVGAGVLLLAIHYGISGITMAISILSLALNLLLTGAFVWFVLYLLRAQKSRDLYSEQSEAV